MLKRGTRLVSLGAAGVCAALVALFLFRPVDDSSLPSTPTVARAFGSNALASAAESAEATGAAPSTAGSLPGAASLADPTGITAAGPVLDSNARDAEVAERQAPLLHGTRAAGADAASEGWGSDPDVDNDRALPSCWVAVSNLPEMYYAIARDDREVWNGSSSARLFALDDRAQHGMLQQTLSAGAFAGRRLAFSAFLKTESAILGVKVWLMAVDSRGTIVAESGTGWLRGTLDWHPQTVVADIPAAAVAITLAFRVLGRGTLWVDRAEVVTVARDGSAAAAGTVTPNRGFLPSPSNALPTAPQNLDFEVWDADAACEGPPAD